MYLTKFTNMKKLLITFTILLSNVLSAQELPQVINDDNQIIRHNGYTISYNETYEQPNWVMYTLKPSDLIGEVKADRKNFKEDTMVSTGSASLNDYKGSGYDRGHLKPAGDEAYDQAQMNETFLMSNVSPMESGFNRGVWVKLENYVRDVAASSDSIIVVTGGVLVIGLKMIGENHVAVPNYFFKNIKVYKNGVMKEYCYLLPNKKTYAELYTFRIELNVRQQLIGLEF